MMVFLLFNEDVDLRERKRVQLDIQRSLVRSPVEIHGGVVRATLEIPPGRTRDLELRFRRSSCVLCVNLLVCGAKRLPPGGSQQRLASR